VNIEWVLQSILMIDQNQLTIFFYVV